MLALKTKLTFGQNRPAHIFLNTNKSILTTRESGIHRICLKQFTTSIQQCSCLREEIGITHTFPAVPGIYPGGHPFPGRGRGASGAGTVAPVRWSRPAAATSGAPCGSPSVGKVGRGFREEVGRNQAPHAIEFSHVETIIVHISVDVDDVPSLKRQLHLQYSEHNTRPSSDSTVVMLYSNSFVRLLFYTITSKVTLTISLKL